jgi:hypothetical protein
MGEELATETMGTPNIAGSSAGLGFGACRLLPSVRAGEVGRSQNQLAEPSVGCLMDPAAFHHRFQVLENMMHGLVAPREDRMANESLDTFDDRGFEVHGDSPNLRQ